MAIKTNKGKEAIIGALIADAATMGVHWIYDTEKLSTLVGEGHPEFFDPPSCPFYTYKSGAQSPWGDEQLQLLQYLVEHEFEEASFHEALYTFTSTYTGRLNGLMKDFDVAYEGGKRGPELSVGADNGQAHGMNKAPFLVAFYGHLDYDEFITESRKIISSHQAHEVAADFGIGGALLLKSLAEGNSVANAIQWLQSFDKTPQCVLDAISDVQQEISAGTSGKAAVRKFGPTCFSPSAFRGALFFLLTSSNYTEAIRANAMAGGDNCSRSMLLGSCFSVVDANSIPEEWKKKTASYSATAELIGIDTSA